MTESKPPSGDEIKRALLSTFGWMSVAGALSVIAIVILALLGPLGKR